LIVGRLENERAVLVADAVGALVEKYGSAPISDADRATPAEMGNFAGSFFAL